MRLCQTTALQSLLCGQFRLLQSTLQPSCFLLWIVKSPDHVHVCWYTHTISIHHSKLTWSILIRSGCIDTLTSDSSVSGLVTSGRFVTIFKLIILVCCCLGTRSDVYWYKSLFTSEAKSLSRISTSWINRHCLQTCWQRNSWNLARLFHKN